LASLPPVYGLYTAIFPPLIFFLFAPSPFQNIGPYAVISVMSLSTGLSPAHHEEIYTGIVVLLTFAVGIIQFAVFALRLGTILSKLIPDAMVSGFMAGSSICVLISQLKEVLGISVPPYKGAGNLILTFIAILRRLPIANWYAFGLAVLSYACMFAFQTTEIYLRVQIPIWYERYCKKQSEPAVDVEAPSDDEPVETPKTPVKAPVAICDVILTVIVVAVVSWKCDMYSKYGVATIGTIPSGFPKPEEPWRVFSYFSKDLAGPLIQEICSSAFSLALVSFVCTYSISKTFEEKAAATAKRIAIATNHPVCGTSAPQASQDLFALSVAALVSSFLCSYVPSSSVSRSSLFANQTNVTTPMGGLFCTICVIIVLYFLGPWFQSVPYACLGTIVIVALWSVTKKIAAGWRRIAAAREKVQQVVHAMDLIKREMDPQADICEPEENIICQVESEHMESVELKEKMEEEVVVGEERKFKEELNILRIKAFLAIRDVTLWWITFLGVMLIDVGTGVLIGMCLAFLFIVVEFVHDRLRKSLSLGDKDK
ncbi:hypothetical protein HDU98_005928, partial [Podochytrium sp. JEL0797]